MLIDSFDTNKKVLIVAEIGNNHEGSIDLAKEMIDSAVKIGVDAVKFQTFIPKNYVSKNYDKKRYDQLKKFQLSQNQFYELYEYATKKNILFFSTPFDLESAKFLIDFVPVIKISSSDLTFLPLVSLVAKTEKPLIISTGFHSLSDIKKTLKIISNYREINSTKLAILHCVGNYPTLPENANLNTVDFYKKKFRDLTVGYSDHTIGPLACEIAVSKGAQIIEKHFTLNKNLSNFQDHKISADPLEMKQIIDNIRSIERYLGYNEKIVNKKEKEISNLVRRKIISKRKLVKGNNLNINDITWVRFDKGISVGSENLILGKIINRNLEEGTVLFENYFN